MFCLGHSQRANQLVTRRVKNPIDSADTTPYALKPITDRIAVRHIESHRLVITGRHGMQGLRQATQIATDQHQGGAMLSGFDGETPTNAGRRTRAYQTTPLEKMRCEILEH